MKLPLLLISMLLCFSLTNAQTELSSFTSTGSGYATSSINDYQSLGINPANLGWTRNNHSMNLGFSELGFSLYSEPLTKKQIINDLYGSPISLDMQGKHDAAKMFTESRLYGNASLLYVGFSYQNEKIGGFAVSVRERFVLHTFLNESAASFLFLGYNDPYFDSTAFENGEQIGYSTNPQKASKVYKGTDQHMLMYREYNLGYGREVINKDNFIWYMGVNFKYLTGLGMSRYYQDENDVLIGAASLSPGFRVEFSGDGVYDGSVDKLEGDGLKTVGSGFGFDIGASFLLMQKLRVGLAVNDIGSITWNKNVYKAIEGRVWRIDTPGIDNYNIFEEGQLIDADNGPPPEDTTFLGIANIKLKLPMHFRGGASYTFNKWVEAGLDVYVPLGDKVPGNFEAPVFGIGTRVNPAKWVQLSISIVSGGKFGTNMPFGITFYPLRNENVTWEVGFATRDMLTWFSQNNPTVSFASGFLRFSFGTKKESTRYLEQDN